MAQAFQSFSEMIRLKKSKFSHQQVRFLNAEFNSCEWRVSWNRRGRWALVPKDGNSLFGPLFSPLNGLKAASNSRKTALKALATKLNEAIVRCNSIPERKKPYVQNPRGNKLICEVFDLVDSHPTMDNGDPLPRAKAVYSEIFSEKPLYVQEIIRARQREKKKQE